VQDAAVVKCCECREEDFVVMTGRSRLPPEVILRKFSQAGWAIGKHARDDLCPACIAKSDKRVKTMDKPATTSLAKPALVIAPPREMSRDDRRVIFAKLEEVYVSEAVGYSPGWSDDRVSKDMNVPRAWVEKIRDENFGPIKDSEEVRKLLQAAEAASAEAKVLAAKVEKLLREAQEIRKAVA